MYIRKATRNYKGKLYTNHLLVESPSIPPKDHVRKSSARLATSHPAPVKRGSNWPIRWRRRSGGQTELFEVDQEVGRLLARARKENHRSRPRDGTTPHTTNLDWATVDPERLEIEDPREAR